MSREDTQRRPGKMMAGVCGMTVTGTKYFEAAARQAGDEVHGSLAVVPGDRNQLPISSDGCVHLLSLKNSTKSRKQEGVSSVALCLGQQSLES